MYWFNKNFINKSFFLILFGLGSMLLSGQNTTTPQATVAPSVQSTSVDTIKNSSLDLSSKKAPWSIDFSSLSDEQIDALDPKTKRIYWNRLKQQNQALTQSIIDKEIENQALIQNINNKKQALAEEQEKAKKLQVIQQRVSWKKDQ